MNENAFLENLKNRQCCAWLNPDLGLEADLPLSQDDIEDASARLERFKPCITELFPETAASGGLIESPLRYIPKMRDAMNQRLSAPIAGKLLLKCDHELPISGSIKARGGIYEVLHFAEEIAIKSGSFSVKDDYRLLAGAEFKEMFSEYALTVGSTGNLGLSIGIMGAALGFSVAVHMSADAKQWKKNLLRSKGVNVIEYPQDYSVAVAEGRKQAQNNPKCHFVDDEQSTDLFLGYAVAAQRLKRQLAQAGVQVDQDHPLCVYLPCGVGGGPAGIAFGLNQIFGPAAHCFFVEPLEMPCVFLGLLTRAWDKISVQEIGLGGKTEADGLAVGRPSRLVCQMMATLLDGCATVSDEALMNSLNELVRNESIFIEPSAAAGFGGLARICAAYPQFNSPRSIHIIWSTGGGMVPPDERARLLIQQSPDP